MAINQDQGEVAFRVVVKGRRVVRVEPAEGTEPLNQVPRITELTADEKRTFGQSVYGLRPIEKIYETNTQGPNTCYIVIDGYKIEVPCM